MKRVAIIGSPGTGKTTFSRELSKKTGLPIIHLDLYYHDTKYDYYHDKPAWRRRVGKLIQQDAWIMDGNYSSTFKLRFKRADTIIFFDYPRRIALYRTLKRRIQYHSKPRQDMPSDWREKINLEFLKFVWDFNKKYRPVKLISQLDENSNRKIIIFKRPRDAKHYLEATW